MAEQEKTENNITVHSAEKKHIDGTIDLVSAEAMGGEEEELPPGYFRNAQFVGTVVVGAPARRSTQLLAGSSPFPRHSQ